MDLGTSLFRSSNEARPVPSPNSTSPPLRPLVDSAEGALLTNTIQQLIDDLPEEIAILDGSCTILTVNRAWKETMEAHGHLESMPPHNYRDLCARSAAEGYEPATEALSALDDIVSGRRNFWQLFYNGRERWDGHDFQICFHRIEVGGESFISVTRFDVTELVELRRAKEDFAHSLIEGQAIERQRMARELHDSTSQLLTTITLLLGNLKRQAPSAKALGLVDELQELVSEAQQEIRSISYLAYPPSLEQMGLARAMKALVEGFGRRTGLEASFAIQGQGAPPPATEGVLYRIAQEALSNVHRHARASRLRVILCLRGSATHLVIADDGIGILLETLAGSSGAGVGLASMRSRMSEIGGRLFVRRLSPGTAIVASVRQEPKIATPSLPKQAVSQLF
jgi:two-component system, NarL family, sensor kinase